MSPLHAIWNQSESYSLAQPWGGKFFRQGIISRSKSEVGNRSGTGAGAYPGQPASLWQNRPKSGVLSPSLVTQAPESLEEKVLVEKLSSEETEVFFSPKTKMKTETKPAPPTVSKSRQWWENVDRKLHGWHPGKDWPPASLSEP